MVFFNQIRVLWSNSLQIPFLKQHFRFCHCPRFVWTVGLFHAPLSSRFFLKRDVVTRERQMMGVLNNRLIAQKLIPGSSMYANNHQPSPFSKSQGNYCALNSQGSSTAFGSAVERVGRPLKTKEWFKQAAYWTDTAGTLFHFNFWLVHSTWTMQRQLDSQSLQYMEELTSWR